MSVLYAHNNMYTMKAVVLSIACLAVLCVVADACARVSVPDVTWGRIPNIPKNYKATCEVVDGGTGELCASNVQAVSDELGRLIAKDTDLDKKHPGVFTANIEKNKQLKVTVDGQKPACSELERECRDEEAFVSGNVTDLVTKLRRHSFWAFCTELVTTRLRKSAGAHVAEIDPDTRTQVRGDFCRHLQSMLTEAVGGVCLSTPVATYNNAAKLVPKLMDIAAENVHLLSDDSMCTQFSWLPAKAKCHRLMGEVRTGLRQDVEDKKTSMLAGLHYVDTRQGARVDSGLTPGAAPPPVAPRGLRSLSPV